MAKISWNNKELKEQNTDSSGINTGIDAGSLSQGYQHGSLTRGLVAYYPMEKGEGQVLHDGALNHLGQINGASWSTDSQIGNKSLSFDGSDDRVELPAIRPNGGFTLSAWVKHPSTSSRRTVILGETNGNSVCYGMYIKSDGTFQTEAQDGSTFVQHSSSTSIDDDNWYHICATWDGSTVRSYLDSVKVNSDSMSGTLKTADDTEIGRRAVTHDQYFSGLISDVRIYNRALSRPEIQALYNTSQHSGKQITSSNIPNTNQSGITRFKFNGSITDSWNTLSDTEITDSTSTGYSSGIYGKSKDFDSSNNDYISLGDNSSFEGMTSFTTSAWVKINSSKFHDIFGKHQGGSTNPSSWKFRIRDTDLVQFGIRDTNNNLYNMKSDNSVTVGDWNHILATYNNSSLKIYLNGRLDKINDIGSYTVNSTSLDTRIGARSDDNSFLDGSVDDLRFYNTALSPQQVEQLYKLGARKINRGDTLQ